MKKLTGTLCMALCAFVCLSQSSQKNIDSAKALISREQYLSAYQVLEQSQETNADVIVLAANIINNHYTSYTEDLNQFGLENRVNGKSVKNEYVRVQLENLLWSAATQYPTDCRIPAEIYSLYVSVFKQRGSYIELKNLTDLNSAIEKHLHARCPDYRSFYLMGFCNNATGQTQTAIGQLQKAIAGNTKFAPAYLQLGKAYLQANDLPNALKQANTAFGLFTERQDKGKASFLTAQVYEASNDHAKALSSYLLADSLYRKDFFIQQALLNLYVKTNNERAPQGLNSFIGAQSRDNIHAYLDAFDIYKKYNRTMDLALFCQKGLSDYKERPGIECCLNFTLGLIYQTINPDMARQYLKKAKELGLDAKRYFPTRNHPNTGQRIEEAYKWLG